MKRKNSRVINRNFKRQEIKQSRRKIMKLSEEQKYNIPENLTIGRAFKTLGLGPVSSRITGEALGRTVDRELLAELARVYSERRDQDPVIIDWQHSTSPYNEGPPAPPASGNALGLIADLELRDDGLYAIPAYNERGLEVVKDAGGVLWSSPEFIAGDVFDRSTGDRIGGAQLLAITLTPRPAQSHNNIDRIILTERLKMDDVTNEEIAKLRADLEARDEMIKELEATIAKLKADSEAAINKAAEDGKHDAEESKLAEDEEDEKTEKLSEPAPSPQLLSEMQVLRESVATLKAERDAIKRDQAVDLLLSEGRISPAEINVVSRAYELKELQPEFWSHFSERAPKVPLNEVGHGASGAEINKMTLDAKIKDLAAAESITYSEALLKVRLNNPNYYNSAFGV